MENKTTIKRVLLKIESLLNYLKNKFINKKTFLVLLGILVIYRISKFPLHISSSDFIKLINESKINNITYSGFLASFTLRGSNEQYLTNYASSNIDTFNSLLSSKNIRFNHVRGLESIVSNPYNQLFALTSVFSYVLMDNLKDSIFDREVVNKENKGVCLNKVLDGLITTQENKDNFILAIDQLLNPKKYKIHQIRPIKGILLYGKPGTGKTLLAKCLSKLNGITFINTCSSEYVEIFVGSGSKRVREIFKQARKNKPSIIFIDELEAIGVQRSNSHSSYTNNIERNATLNQLLAEMDGLENNDGVLIISATNREDLLDAALVRPGRFDMKINLGLPSKEERKRIFELYLKKQELYFKDTDKCLSSDQAFLDELAEDSESLTGAIIEDIITKSSAICYSKGENNLNKITIFDTLEKSKKEHLKFKAYEEKNKYGQ